MIPLEINLNITGPDIINIVWVLVIGWIVVAIIRNM